MNAGAFSVAVPAGMPLVSAGDDLAGDIVAACLGCGIALSGDQVVVVAQKVISKAEGRSAELGEVAPGAEARELAARTGREPTLAELVLNESQRVMRASPQAIITRHRTGHVTTNSGIDASNVGEGEGRVLLWPVDPDASARALRAAIKRLTGHAPAVVIADSLGRAWRQGTLGTAIGAAGLVVTDDRRGQQDMFGRTLQATVVAIADPIAAFAVLAMGEGAEGTPVAIVSGAGRWITEEDGPGATAILRPVEGDLFP